MNLVIKAGIFFFRWRDTLFSLIFLAGLYLLSISEKTFLFHFIGNFKEDLIFSALGFIFVVIGIGIRAITIGYIYIKRAGLNKKIHAEQLFKEGLFSHCRNPLYLGNLFVVTGAIISLNIYLYWIVILPLFYFIYYSIIRAEEEFLKNKFKEEYINYIKDVPRLIPGNLNRFPESFKNLNFSLKRVIKVEHSTQFLVFFTILLINILKFRFRYNISWENPYFQIIYFIMILLIIYQITAAILKRKGKLD
ncbi:MAG: lipid A Kdo2 1-phosphate O-methyltransferase [Leptospiraceae bacterium]|nr:MAG: lipid A Kdo2 1-phosphate O-methyltransferase [Leptospiraceae bacterium]